MLTSSESSKPLSEPELSLESCFLEDTDAPFFKLPVVLDWDAVLAGFLK